MDLHQWEIRLATGATVFLANWTASFRREFLAASSPVAELVDEIVRPRLRIDSRMDTVNDIGGAWLISY